MITLVQQNRDLGDVLATFSLLMEDLQLVGRQGFSGITVLAEPANEHRDPIEKLFYAYRRALGMFTNPAVEFILKGNTASLKMSRDGIDVILNVRERIPGTFEITFKLTGANTPLISFVEQFLPDERWTMPESGMGGDPIRSTELRSEFYTLTGVS